MGNKKKVDLVLLSGNVKKLKILISNVKELKKESLRNLVNEFVELMAPFHHSFRREISPFQLIWDFFPRFHRSRKDRKATTNPPKQVLDQYKPLLVLFTQICIKHGVLFTPASESSKLNVNEIKAILLTSSLAMDLLVVLEECELDDGALRIEVDDGYLMENMHYQLSKKLLESNLGPKYNLLAEMHLKCINKVVWKKHRLLCQQKNIFCTELEVGYSSGGDNIQKNTKNEFEQILKLCRFPVPATNIHSDQMARLIIGTLCSVANVIIPLQEHQHDIYEILVSMDGSALDWLEYLEGSNYVFKSKKIGENATLNLSKILSVYYDRIFRSLWKTANLLEENYNSTTPEHVKLIMACRSKAFLCMAKQQIVSNIFVPKKFIQQILRCGLQFEKKTLEGNNDLSKKALFIFYADITCIIFTKLIPSTNEILKSFGEIFNEYINWLEHFINLCISLGEYRDACIVLLLFFSCRKIDLANLGLWQGTLHLMFANILTEWHSSFSKKLGSASSEVGSNLYDTWRTQASTEAVLNAAYLSISADMKLHESLENAFIKEACCFAEVRSSYIKLLEEASALLDCQSHMINFEKYYLFNIYKYWIMETSNSLLSPSCLCIESIRSSLKVQLHYFDTVSLNFVDKDYKYIVQNEIKLFRLLVNGYCRSIAMTLTCNDQLEACMCLISELAEVTQQFVSKLTNLSSFSDAIGSNSALIHELQLISGDLHTIVLKTYAANYGTEATANILERAIAILVYTNPQADRLAAMYFLHCKLLIRGNLWYQALLASQFVLFYSWVANHEVEKLQKYVMQYVSLLVHSSEFAESSMQEMSNLFFCHQIDLSSTICSNPIQGVLWQVYQTVRQMSDRIQKCFHCASSSLQRILGPFTLYGDGYSKGDSLLKLYKNCINCGNLFFQFLMKHDGVDMKVAQLWQHLHSSLASRRLAYASFYLTKEEHSFDMVDEDFQKLARFITSRAQEKLISCFAMFWYGIHAIEQQTIELRLLHSSERKLIDSTELFKTSIEMLKEMKPKGDNFFYGELVVSCVNEMARIYQMLQLTAFEMKCRQFLFDYNHSIMNVMEKARQSFLVEESVEKALDYLELALSNLAATKNGQKETIYEDLLKLFDDRVPQNKIHWEIVASRLIKSNDSIVLMTACEWILNLYHQMQNNEKIKKSNTLEETSLCLSLCKRQIASSYSSCFNSIDTVQIWEYDDCAAIQAIIRVLTSLAQLWHQRGNPHRSYGYSLEALTLAKRAMVGIDPIRWETQYHFNKFALSRNRLVDVNFTSFPISSLSTKQQRLHRLQQADLLRKQKKYKEAVAEYTDLLITENCNLRATCLRKCSKCYLKLLAEKNFETKELFVKALEYSDQAVQLTKSCLNKMEYAVNLSQYGAVSLVGYLYMNRGSELGIKALEEAFVLVHQHQLEEKQQPRAMILLRHIMRGLSSLYQHKDKCLYMSQMSIGLSLNWNLPQATSKKENQLRLSLQKLNIDDERYVIKQVKAYRNRIVQDLSLPGTSIWTIVSLSCDTAGGCVLTRLQTNHSTPLLHQMNGNKFKLLVSYLDEIIHESRETLSSDRLKDAPNWSNKEKKKWWLKRSELDLRMKDLVNTMEQELGFWKCMFISEPIATSAKNKVTNLLEGILNKISIHNIKNSSPKKDIQEDAIEIFRLLINSRYNLSKVELQNGMMYVLKTYDILFDSSSVENFAAELLSQVIFRSSKHHNTIKKRQNKRIQKTLVYKKTSNPTPIEKNKLGKMKVVELKKALQERNLPVSGLKKVLLSRLVEALEEEETEVTSENSSEDDNEDGDESAGSVDEEDIKGELNISDVGRHPVILVLDEELHSFPWESQSFYQHCSVSRVPSFELLFQYVYNLEEDPLTYNLLNLKKVQYIVNPGGDLQCTEKSLTPLLRDSTQLYPVTSSWEGVIGSTPSQFQTYLAESQLVIYCGHGSGEKYCHRDEVPTKCSAALLIGCSSAKLHQEGSYEPSGMILSYLIAGSPAVVGMLWDVTDRDIDRFSLKLLQSIFEAQPQKQSLAQLLPGARSVCKLPHLIGYAAVTYGIPVYFAPSDSLQ